MSPLPTELVPQVPSSWRRVQDSPCPPAQSLGIILPRSRTPSPFILTSWNPSVLPACPWLSSKDPEGSVVGRLRGAGADAGAGRTGCVAGGTQDVTQATGRS